ncbi:flavodoxin [Curtobacterium sp. YR515]|uniref:flavodoxin n=1 Tax=Curtobacterium sp. YR515 TaxID=1855316 RepID=UPI0008DFDDC1|nr:flavodoxin [Curtobacterium sp. YR515]SFF73838.1 Flavodoxin [Curtobacterium sp. YR515]
MRKPYRLIALLTLGVVAIAGLTVTNVLTAADTSRPPDSRPSQQAAADGPNESSAPASEDLGAPAADALVVYFSRTGENFPNLDLDIGNTARLAIAIDEHVDGDIYEIVPADPYPADRDDTSEQAQREQDEGIYPNIAGAQPDTSAYDTVFLGYPNWWGEQPMIVQTFMRDHDLGDATIVPFTTHDGSGFGNSLNVLEDYYPDANILDGLAMRGADVADDPDAVQGEVDEWLDGLGF